MPFKTTINWLFNDIWYYLVTGCFDWQFGIFQHSVVRVYYILKFETFPQLILFTFPLNALERLIFIKTSRYWCRKEIEPNYKEKFVSSDNPEQNIWQKVAKAGKIGQDQSGIKAGH